MAKPYKSVLTRHQLQQLAGTFRHHVEQWLEKKSESYLNKLEEVFFTHAEQASSDAHQRIFIDAVRELRQKRHSIGTHFQNNLLKAVETFFLHYEAYLEEFIHGFSVSTQPQESLELVNNEKLEEDLVILRTSHRVTSRMQMVHKELTAYMAAVIQPKDLPQLGIPLAPSVIATCLRMALQEWEGPVTTRFIFYQVLADDMLSDLDKLYPPLIKVLQQMGLEPVETTVKRRQANHAASPSAHRRLSGGPRLSSDENEESTLFSIVSLVRQLNEEERQVLGLARSVAGSRPPTGMAIKPEVVAEVIREMQPANEQYGVTDLKRARSAQQVFKESLAQMLEETLERRQAHLHNLDQQVLDIVTMLFDFVLDDSLMPDSMKVLLVRLQIPVLQIAIRDKTFLTNRRHPARVLINNLSRAAVRWADVGDYSPGSVYGMIRRSVERILEGDNTDLELYLEVNRDFEQFLALEERGARVAEERVSQVARGKEQLALARRHVSEALAELMDDDLPPMVQQILNDAWRDVLTLTLLREGEESEAWRESLAVARRLVESVHWAQEPPQREVLGSEFHALLGDLRRGFASISYDTKKSASLLEGFQSCYEARLQQTPARDERCGERPQEKEEAGAGEATVSTGADKYERLVRSLREGQWLRWEVPGEGEKRGKLAWRSDIADLLLFVDMRGRKLAEHTSDDLIRLFRNGQASLLSNIDQPFIERALRCIHQVITTRLAPHTPPILPA